MPHGSDEETDDPATAAIVPTTVEYVFGSVRASQRNPLKVSLVTVTVIKEEKQVVYYIQLSTALTQCYFDYSSSSWYGGLNKSLKHKLQVAQNR